MAASLGSWNTAMPPASCETGGAGPWARTAATTAAAAAAATAGGPSRSSRPAGRPASGPLANRCLTAGPPADMRAFAAAATAGSGGGGAAKKSRISCSSSKATALPFDFKRDAGEPAQLLANPVQAGTHRPVGNTERHRDVRVAEPAERDEQQHLPVAAGKLRERPCKLATHHRSVDPLGDAIRMSFLDTLGASPRQPAVCPHLLAVVRAHVIGRDPVQPRPHRAAAGIKPSARSERGQERLRSHVIRGVAAEPSRDVSVYLSEVPVENRPEALRLA